jgi:hypothetical protein
MLFELLRRLFQHTLLLGRDVLRHGHLDLGVEVAGGIIRSHTLTFQTQPITGL